MNLRDLTYLVSVADHRHFGKAAEACNVSQPTLSMQLKKLEEFLGVALFERRHKQSLLTPAGEEIVARARIILSEADHIRTLARNASDPLGGTLQLGIIPTIAPYVLPHLLPALKTAYPQLEIQLREEQTHRLLEALIEGDIDAALLALPLEANPTTLTSMPLYEEPFLLALPNHHPLQRKNAVTAQDIAGTDILLLEEGHCLRQQALSFCERAGAKEQNGTRATSLETLRHLTAAGMGVTLLPALACLTPYADIITRPFQPTAPSRTIGLVWRHSFPRHTLLTAVGKVIQHTITPLLHPK